MRSAVTRVTACRLDSETIRQVSCSDPESPESTRIDRGPGNRGTVYSSRPNRAVVGGTSGCCIDWRKSFCDFDRRGYLQAALTVGVDDASRCRRQVTVARYRRGDAPSRLRESQRLVAQSGIRRDYKARANRRNAATVETARAILSDFRGLRTISNKPVRQAVPARITIADTAAIR